MPEARLAALSLLKMIPANYREVALNVRGG